MGSLGTGSGRRAVVELKRFPNKLRSLNGTGEMFEPVVDPDMRFLIVPLFLAGGLDEIAEIFVTLLPPAEPSETPPKEREIWVIHIQT